MDAFKRAIQVIISIITILLLLYVGYVIFTKLPA